MDTDGDNKSVNLRNTIYTKREIFVASSEKYICGDRCCRMDTEETMILIHTKYTLEEIYA